MSVALTVRDYYHYCFNNCFDLRCFEIHDHEKTPRKITLAPLLSTHSWGHYSNHFDFLLSVSHGSDFIGIHKFHARVCSSWNFIARTAHLRDYSGSKRTLETLGHGGKQKTQNNSHP